MTNKKAGAKALAPATTLQVQAGVDGIKEGMNHSQCLAAMATRSSLSAFSLHKYAGGNDVEVMDLMAELKKAGTEVVAGDLSRVEKMLTNQAIVLDNMFNNLAQRASQQESLKGIEVFLRLAMKAQAQSRATAEALAEIKNPAPYIRQANIAQGHQQINNTYAGERARGEIVESAPNKLLEAENHGQRLDTRAQGATGRADQKLETVGAVQRPQKRSRQSQGGS